MFFAFIGGRYFNLNEDSTIVFETVISNDSIYYNNYDGAPLEAHFAMSELFIENTVISSTG